jgi:hypothetical protein
MLLKIKLKWKRDYMNEEESNEFLEKMMESNRERIDYEIDDDLFDKCIFDNDGNLIGFNWER